MIPPITKPPIPNLYPIDASSIPYFIDANFEALSFTEKLKKIGLIDGHFNILFQPSFIPKVSEKGQKRFDQLMKQEIHCLTDDGDISIKQSDYISGFSHSLKNTGIQIQTYLRGGSAAYVADLDHYFEFLIHEFLAFKCLPKDLLEKELEMMKCQHEEVPHDVDIFDHVLNDNYPATGLELFYIEFLKGLVGQGKKIRFIQRLIPEVSPLFPYPENYVLFTLGNPNEKFQTDRIIGKLSHEFLHMRDNIRIKIQDNQMGIPESVGNFWQMLVDRKLKIVRTEAWHQKDFRTGLAALQLIQDGHLLIEDHCTLQSILQYALSIGSDKIFRGALDRAKLHCKDPASFLITVLIAYSHAAPLRKEHLNILKDALGEIPPLASLYKYALLLTAYSDKTCSANWDPAGFLILNWNGKRIVFPKNFSDTSTEPPFFGSEIHSFVKTSPVLLDPIYKVLDGELSHLERVLFELALQKPDTPLSEPLLEALVEYLIHRDDLQERMALATLLPKGFLISPLKIDWIKVFIQYSFKYGLKLWNGLKNQMDAEPKWQAFEEMILHIVKERPNQSYVLLDEELPPKTLRIKLLKKIIESPFLSLQSSARIIEELALENALGPETHAFLIKTLETLPIKEGYELWKKLDPSILSKLIQIGDRLISSNNPIEKEDEAWFFNSSPSKTRIEALSGNLELLKKWIDWRMVHDFEEAKTVFQNHIPAFKTLPETYIHYIKQFDLRHLVKQWFESFPISERMAEALKFFRGYEPEHRPLLEMVCALPGFHERKLLEALYSNGHPVFKGRDFSELLNLLKLDFPSIVKNEILKTLALMPLKDVDLARWMKANIPLSLELFSHLMEKEDFLPIAIAHLVFLKSTKNKLSLDPRFIPICLEVIDRLGISKELIPFFENRGFVKSVFGVDAETKTKQWGELLIAKGNLKKADLVSVRNILSRLHLQFTPLKNLLQFLESFRNEKIVNEDLLKIAYHETLSKLHKSVQEDSTERFHHFIAFFELLKLGIASKVQSIAVFTLLDEIFRFIPIFIHQGGTIDPLSNLLQAFPLVDYGSEELHYTWNSGRYELLLKWLEVELSNDDCKLKTIKDTKPKPLIIVPYSSLKEFLKYAHLFKLITEQYIESKVSKEEFQQEVRDLSKSMSQTIKDQNLMPHEDPCLICIRDFSGFLKIPDKRVRTYEAFHYILKERKATLLEKSEFIEAQSKYLSTRQAVEDFIISKNKGLYSTFLFAFREYLKKTHPSLDLNNLIYQDPVLDALELESIHHINKMELLRMWTAELIQTPTPVAEYYVKRLESLLQFEKKRLNAKETYAFILEIIERLKMAKGISSRDRETEGISIFQASSLYLPKEMIKKLHGPIEYAAQIKIPFFFIDHNNNKASEKNSSIKSCLEAHGCGNVKDENLLVSYNAATLQLAEQLSSEELPYYPFFMLLKLVQMGLRSGISPPACFLPMAMLISKAPLFIVSLKEEVVFDPYLNGLLSLTLIDAESEEEFNLMNKLKTEALQSWVHKLSLSENATIASYGKNLKILEFPSFEKLKLNRKYVDKFKFIIQRFTDQMTSGETFKEDINRLVDLILKNSSDFEFSKYEDPCFTALLELSPLLANREKHMLTYAAFNHVYTEWMKNLKVPPSYIAEFKVYLTRRRSTEDLVFSQMQLLEDNKIVYTEFFKNFSSHLYSSYGSYLPENIHINDPVFDALDSLPRINKIECLKRWVNLLRRSETPFGLYQAEAVSSYIQFESKKIGGKDIETFVADRLLKLRKAKLLKNEDTYNSEFATFIETASAFDSPEFTLSELIQHLSELTESLK